MPSRRKTRVLRRVAIVAATVSGRVHAEELLDHFVAEARDRHGVEALERRDLDEVAEDVAGVEERAPVAALAVAPRVAEPLAGEQDDGFRGRDRGVPERRAVQRG